MVLYFTFLLFTSISKWYFYFDRISGQFKNSGKQKSIERSLKKLSGI